MTHADRYEALAKYLIPFAQEVLAKAGEFYPTAAFVNKEGKVEGYSVYLGEHPDREALFAAHVEALRRDAGVKGYQATGLLADGRAAHPDGGEKTDAILVSLEDRSADAIVVVMHYRRGTDGRFEYADAYSVVGQPQIFT